MKRVLAIAVCFPFFFGGCDRADKAQLQSEARDEGRTLADVTFVVVNGRRITAQDMHDRVMLRAKGLEISGRPVKENRFEKWANNEAMRIFPSEIVERLLEDEIARTGFVPSEKDRATVLANYQRTLRKRKVPKEDLAELFGEFRPAFDAQFERSVRIKGFLGQAIDTNVTDLAVSSYLQNQTNFVTQCRRIDAQARQNADEVLRRYRSGTPWPTLAKEFSEDRLVDEDNADFGRHWGDFTCDDQTLDEAVRLALATTGVNRVTGPIETDEGLVIVRVDALTNETYSCSRILFRLSVGAEVPEWNEARKSLVEGKRKNGYRELIARLRAQAKFEYPRGTNFTYKIWNQGQSSGRK